MRQAFDNLWSLRAAAGILKWTVNLFWFTVICQAECRERALYGAWAIQSLRVRCGLATAAQRSAWTRRSRRARFSAMLALR